MPAWAAPVLRSRQAWKSDVAGFDRNPDLVQAGTSFLRTQKAGRRVQLAPYDPENFALRAGFYDCVMAREVISTLVDKEAFFHAVSLGLKSFGQIVITDFVRGDVPANDSGLRRLGRDAGKRSRCCGRARTMSPVSSASVATS